MLRFQELHDESRWLAVHEESFHDVHCRSHMGKELMVALTEVVEPALTGGSLAEPVFRALAIAGKVPFALLALGR